VVGFATRPDEVTVRGTLADIADLVAASGITRTAVIIVGRVLDRVGGDRTLRSFLYSDDRPRDADGRTMRGPGAAAPAGDPVPAPPAAGGAPHSARRPAQTPPAPRPPQAPPRSEEHTSE